jgi:hypothetical protein
VLEPLALLGRRRAAQRLEAAIDLDRVAGDRDRILAAVTQQVGDGDRYGRLPDPGRAEDREDPQSRALRSS